MDKSYLIPANSKKSILIFGLFTGSDLAIAAVGIGLSLILMMTLPVGTFWVAILSILPGFIAAFLVFPVPNYHNIRTIIRNAWEFYTTRQKYIWKGWCFDNGETDKK
jgi:hypothetical protein